MFIFLVVVGTKENLPIDEIRIRFVTVVIFFLEFLMRINKYISELLSA